MIRHIRTSNWKGTDASVSLTEPVSILFGPNGSGKSAILEAVQFLVTGRIASAGRLEQIATRCERGHESAIEVTFIDRTHLRRELVPKDDGGWTSRVFVNHTDVGVKQGNKLIGRLLGDCLPVIRLTHFFEGSALRKIHQLVLWCAGLPGGEALEALHAQTIELREAVKTARADAKAASQAAKQLADCDSPLAGTVDERRLRVSEIDDHLRALRVADVEEQTESRVHRAWIAGLRRVFETGAAGDSGDAVLDAMMAELFPDDPNTVMRLLDDTDGGSAYRSHTATERTVQIEGLERERTQLEGEIERLIASDERERALQQAVHQRGLSEGFAGVKERELKAAIAERNRELSVWMEQLFGKMRDVVSWMDPFIEIEGDRVEIGLVRPGSGRRIALDALSGGERVMYELALGYAVMALREPIFSILLVEASEVDVVHMRSLAASFDRRCRSGVMTQVILATHVDVESWIPEAVQMVRLES